MRKISGVEDSRENSGWFASLLIICHVQGDPDEDQTKDNGGNSVNVHF